MENYLQMNFTPAQVNAISNLGLAHVGDGVYELMCRSWLCTKGDKTVLKLHRGAVEMVKEFAYYRRGKNAHTHVAPKAASRLEYAKATGLETMFGALYLMGRTDRLNELFQIIINEET